jgi:hypothetical protein
MLRIRLEQGGGSTWLGAIAGLAMLLAPVPSMAGPGDALHEVSWGHPSPSSVRSFIVYIAPESGAIELARQVDVGVPAGQTLGSLRLYTAIVSSEEDEYIAVAALGRNGLLSPLSSWGRVQPTQPGQPKLVQP